MKFRLVSFLVYWTARLLLRTLRLRVTGEERVSELQNQGTGVILVTWHGRTMVPMSRFRNRGYWAIISTSRDGELQNWIFRRFGWNTVRGSTSARGAVKSALAMVRHLKAGATLAFTPDGPRGPSHQVQPGVIFLAQKSGCPIIPAGLSAYPRKLMPTWDHYLLPMPFGRTALIYGEPIYIPAEARSEEEQRQWADHIGAVMDTLEGEAERLVNSRVAHGRAPRDASQWHRV